MANAIEIGKPISAEDAHKYMQTFIPLKRFLKNNILEGGITKEVSSETQFSPTKKLFQSEVNAFIFDKKTIMRFFEGSDQADILMVILGTKFQTEELGNPTVVLAGVRATDDPNVFKSLNIEFPATEQPPRLVLTDFPKQNETLPPDTLKFNLI